MATWRGANGGAYTSASSSTLSLPAGTVAGDFCVAVLGNVFTGSSITGITSWDTRLTLDTYGTTYLLAKKLTAADIAAGSVTATFNGSGPGYSAIATAAADFGKAAAGPVSHPNGQAVSSNRLVASALMNGDILVYLSTTRRDGTTPSVAVSQGSLINESGANGGSNWGFAGGIRYRELAANGNDDTTFDYGTAGQGDMAVTWLFANGPRTGGVAPDLAVAAAGTANAFVYKGRRTKAEDTGGVP